MAGRGQADRRRHACHLGIESSYESTLRCLESSVANRLAHQQRRGGLGGAAGELALARRTQRRWQAQHGGLGGEPGAEEASQAHGDV
jgi:hypothetical protein